MFPISNQIAPLQNLCAANGFTALLIMRATDIEFLADTDIADNWHLH